MEQANMFNLLELLSFLEPCISEIHDQNKMKRLDLQIKLKWTQILYELCITEKYAKHKGK